MTSRILILTIAASLFFACAPKEETTTDNSLSGLKAQRTQLQKEINGLNKQISDLDISIAKLDTAKRLALVTTLPVMEKQFDHFFEVQGIIEADKNVILYPEMGGTVRQISVREGQKVSKGEILVSLDTELIELQIKELQTNLELATTTFERQKRLWDQKIGSEMQFLQAKAQKESLETSVATLKAQLRKNRIVAPFSGIVDEIWPKIGELTSPASPVIRLVNLDKIYLSADVSESYIATVKKGTVVEVNFPAYDITVPAKVKMVGNFINPGNRTFKVTVDVENRDNMIKPNLMGYLKIRDFSVDSGIVVPQRLIQEDPNGNNFIYTVKNSKKKTTAYRKPVKVGPTYKKETLIISGITTGAILVDKGSRSIKNDQTVLVEN